jgi:calcineurin-like phosphoesterase
MPQGMGYISDIGMNGNYHSVIGVDYAGPVRSFLTQLKPPKVFTEGGPLEVGALLLEVDPIAGTTTNIVQIRKILNATGTS